MEKLLQIAIVLGTQTLPRLTFSYWYEKDYKVGQEMFVNTVSPPPSQPPPPTHLTTARLMTNPNITFWYGELPSTVVQSIKASFKLTWWCFLLYFLTMSKLLELCACVWTVDVCALIALKYIDTYMLWLHSVAHNKQAGACVPGDGSDQHSPSLLLLPAARFHFYLYNWNCDLPLPAVGQL